MRRLLAIGLLAGVVSYLPVAISRVLADCQVEAPTSQGSFTVHLGAGCTEAEREARAIDGTSVIQALKDGKTVDLSGVVIRGDVRFSDLPAGKLPKNLASRVAGEAGDMRVVPAAFTIVRSIVRGAVRHTSERGRLIFYGPVNVSGTTFEQIVDLSRAVFVQPVTWSGAIFLRESYFVQGQFMADVFAERTAFGPHTRFHRSRFSGPVTFQQSGFSGMAEFLEVEFDRAADFSRTYFKLGTGFSGSHFRQMADFSEALFDREAFFTFTQFGGDAFFRRATFRSTADFDDARFEGRDDFEKVLFEGESKFSRVQRPSRPPVAIGIESPQVQYAITLSLLLFSALLMAYLIRAR
jgi:hypothetical protein